MRPTITANDELLLPNGKMYVISYPVWAIENIDIFIVKRCTRLIGLLVI